MFQAPFVICADFESNLKVIQKPNRDNYNAFYFDKYQVRIGCSYGYQDGCIDDRFSKPVLTY